MTDETIYLVAHRDGWFDAAGDNASGVASIVALAEYYAKVPQTDRRRTMIFVGLDGHHNSGTGAGVGRRWMWDNRARLFPKTALVINAEHPSTIQTTVRPRYYQSGDTIVWSNTYMPQQWYAGGPSRRTLETIAVHAFRAFGASMYLDPNPRPPAGDLGALFRGVPGVATSEFYHYFHTDQETPDAVPWTGLEATTRVVREDHRRGQQGAADRAATPRGAVARTATVGYSRSKARTPSSQDRRATPGSAQRRTPKSYCRICIAPHPRRAATS